MNLSSREFSSLMFLSLGFLNCCFLVPAIQHNVVSNDLITVVCYSTKNPSYCEQLLRSSPQPPGGKDLRGLCKVSIDAAKTTGKSAYNVIVSLKEYIKDPKILKELNLCLTSFADANGAIDKCNESWTNHNYGDVYTKAVGAALLVDFCETAFSEKGLPEPTELKKAAKKFQDTDDIVKVLASRLIGQNGTLK